MDGKEFVASLQAEMQELFSRLGETETLESESGGDVRVVTLLKLALTSELEASEIAALWMPTTPELDAKLALAHQCGDEMKHYHLIERRLRELGEDLAGSHVGEPLAQFRRCGAVIVRKQGRRDGGPSKGPRSGL